MVVQKPVDFCHESCFYVIVKPVVPHSLDIKRLGLPVFGDGRVQGLAVIDGDNLVVLSVHNQALALYLVDAVNVGKLVAQHGEPAVKDDPIHRGKGRMQY